MKKVIEFNPIYNIGDIVYGLFNNKVIKVKIIAVHYSKKSTFVPNDFETRVSYEASSLDNNLGIYSIAEGKQDYLNGIWFKSKDDIIDYLKTQIDKITTDEYN